MSSAQRLRSSTATPSDGSRTITVIPTPATDATSSAPPNTGSLKLRGAHRKPQVAWTDDTVDNEGCGRKSSKICCIYHKPKRFDESSDEDSSSDEEGRHSHSRTCNHKHAEVSTVEEPPEPNAYEADPSKKGKGKA